MEDQERLLKTTTVARMLNQSDQTIRNWFDEGILRGIEIPNRLRRTILIYKSSVNLLMEDTNL